MIFKISLLR